MKKLYTILFTIILSLLAISPAFAICESHDNFWNTLQNANYQFTYTLNNGSTQVTGASDGVLLTANNVKAYGDLTTFFNLDHLWKYINLTGIITITSTVPNQLSNEFIINNMSSPTLLYQMDGGGFVEWGTCEFTSMTLNNLSEFVVDSSTGADRYNQQNINYSVKCYVGENAEPTRIQALRFHLWKNQYNSSTSMNANISIVHHLSSDYQTYQGEYNNELCRIQELLQGISSGSGSGGTTSQDIENQTQQIIQNNNNNTQQIVDQLTNETCEQVQCDNIIPLSLSAGYSGFNYTYSDNVITATHDRTNALISLNNSGRILLERGTTYYYNYIVSDGSTGDIRTVLSLGSAPTGTSGSFTTLSDRDTTLNGWQFSNITNGTKVFLYIGKTQNGSCVYGSTNDVCTGENRLDNISNSINDVNNTLNNSSTSQADSKMSDIIDNFESPDYGFAEFIFLPFNFFRMILNPVCQPIQLQVPYVTTNNVITLPCYNTILQENFPSLMTLIHIVTDGLIVYYCCVTIFRTCQMVLDPEKANLEVFDL